MKVVQSKLNRKSLKLVIVLMNDPVVEYESDYELPCIGCSTLNVEDT